jgi:tripeptidyl-peptidase I
MFTRLSGFIILFIVSTTCNCDPSAAAEGLRVLGTFLGESPRFTTNSHVFKENMPSVSTRDDLQRLDRVHTDVVHEIIFVIRQRNMETLTEMLYDISNPESPNYGQHLTREQLTDMTINIEACEAVQHHLAESGLLVKDMSPGGEFIIAEAPIQILEKFFKTEFYHFEVSSTSGPDRRFVRADKYSVPSALDLHVESVLNIVEVPDDAYIRPISGPKTRSSSDSSSFKTSGYFDVIRPADLKAFYNMSSIAKGSLKSTQLVFGSLNQYYSPSDLKAFQTATKSTILAPTSIGSHANDMMCLYYPDNCVEANLDLQYIMTMSPGSATTFWYTDSEFAAWMVSVAAYTPLPLVISISYGKEEKDVTKGESDAFNMIALKLNIMGITILAASGDDGANSRSARGKKTSFCGYTPLFPATSPYVTAVGATSVCFLFSTSMIISLLLLLISILLIPFLYLLLLNLYHLLGSRNKNN